MLYYKVHQTKDLKKEDVAVHNYAKLSLCSNNKIFFPLNSTLVADKEGKMAAKNIEGHQIWVYSCMKIC